jgi:hypothetical protein
MVLLPDWNSEEQPGRDLVKNNEEDAVVERNV